MIKLSQIEHIKIDETTYDIDWFVAADLKMLAIMFGINAANSHHACIWCDCNLYELPNKNSVFPINRTLTKSYELFPVHKLGYVNEPILQFVDFKNCVVDLLHLFLRISDKLFELLIEKLISIDGNDSEDLEKRETFKIFCDLLSQKCKVTKPFYLSQKDKGNKIKLRSFNGEERLRIFQNLHYDDKNKPTLLSSFFPEKVNLLLEDYVWREFYHLYQMTKSYTNNPYDLSFPISYLESELKKWLVRYLKLNAGFDNLSCYAHAFCFHVPQMIKIHGDINIFNCNGIEKLNDFASQYFHFCTNKHKKNLDYLRQMLEKRNRIEFYTLDGKLTDFF